MAFSSLSFASPWIVMPSFMAHARAVTSLAYSTPVSFHAASDSLRHASDETCSGAAIKVARFCRARACLCGYTLSRR